MKSAEIIDELTHQLDENTKHHLPTYRDLLLFGSANSVFLKAIMRKACSFGVRCSIYQDNISNHNISRQNGIVVDMETFEGTIWHPNWNPVNDLDGLIYNARPCVTTAMIRLLEKANLVNEKSITIVGRGHSTAGLAKYLIQNDATITVAHSKTLDLFSATHDRDVVLLCVPKLDQDISYNTKAMVIDLGLAAPRPEQYSCDYVTMIGKLTISILLNRLITGIGISDFRG